MSRTLNRAFRIERAIHSLGHGEHAIPLMGPVPYVTAGVFVVTLVLWGFLLGGVLGYEFQPVIPGLVWLGPPMLAARLSRVAVADERRPGPWLVANGRFVAGRLAGSRRRSGSVRVSGGWRRG